MPRRSTEVPPNLMTRGLALAASRPTECLIQVAQDVVGGLETDGEPDVVGVTPVALCSSTESWEWSRPGG